MSYEDALADLKADFGKKKLLTPADIAPYIDKSPSAQASMRSRKQFPIAKKDVGGRVVVSIYDFARFIGGDDADGTSVPEQIRIATPQKKTSKSRKVVDKSKPFRRPPSLGKTLQALRGRQEAMALQMEFECALYADLEAIETERSTKAGTSSTRLPPL